MNVCVCVCVCVCACVHVFVFASTCVCILLCSQTGLCQSLSVVHVHIIQFMRQVIESGLAILRKSGPDTPKVHQLKVYC